MISPLTQFLYFLFLPFISPKFVLLITYKNFLCSVKFTVVEINTRKGRKKCLTGFFFFWRGLVRGSVMAGNFLARFRKQSSWRRRWNSRRNSTHSGKEKQRGVCWKYCEYSGVLLLPHKEQERVVISRSLGLLGYSSI